MRLGETHIEAEGVLDAEIAHAPRLRDQRRHDAAHRPRDTIARIQLVNGHDDLDSVAALARGEAAKVRVLAHGRRAAPEAQDARAAPQDEVAVALPGRLLADGRETETAVEALRARKIGDVELDEDVAAGGSHPRAPAQVAVAYFAKNETVARIPLK